MEKILPLRKRIDEIDEQILRFLKERIDICENIGTIKREHGLPVKDPNRENEHTCVSRKQRQNWDLTRKKLELCTKK